MSPPQAVTETTPPERAADPAKPTVALALGAGGAKGLAHIGVIEELEAQGFQIVAIAGTSMGALIGGIHAMGKLDVYRDWVCALAKLDVLRLVDWTFSGGGLIKGERIIGTLRGLIGDTQIEELPLSFTAVATDLDRGREVWLSHGSLFDAIRASISVPTVFRPHALHGRRLVDGALLNPVPVTPLIGARADYVFAVSVDGVAEATLEAPPREAVDEGGYRHRISDFINRLMPQGEPRPRAQGTLDTLTQAMDLMQANLARLRLAAYAPDLLIEMPRNIASVYEFYRARELIERGRLQTRAALRDWAAPDGPQRSP
ncbi:MAG: patatin-like phospholipase family protein [Pseudomonadota bacterium]|nr:patatin-like phospholipase family protein [Xanthomonadaceae bacterium]MDE3071211.1 patatin-like phospholipase family protein [Pseudomonadota bacterium]MDE3209213.1 patatin-like phospholipase family protein [Pseudomonadota bacterium]